MRRLLVLLATLSLMVTVVVPALAQDGSVRIDGGGFGHGVGMSQYGAKSMAAKGYGANRILEHYYRGTEVVNRDLGVLTVGLSTEDETTFTNRSSSENPLVLRRASDRSDVVFRVEPGRTLQVEHTSGTTCRATVGSNSKMAPCGDLQLVWTYQRPSDSDPVGEPGTLVHMPRSDSHDLTLARGYISFTQPNDRTKHGNLHTRLRIHTQEYLFGLAEVPSSWPQATLRAQATAGRTFALRRAENPRGAPCSCDLLTTVSDQHYTGWAKENEATYGKRWVQAVTGSGDGLYRGAVVTYDGSLAQTFYSSSNIGVTEDSRDIWGGSVPYLLSVSDPYSIDADAGNPNATWTERPSYTTFAERLGFDRITRMKVVERNRSGTPGTWEITGSDAGRDRTERMRGTAVRTALKLRSHAITGLSVVQPHIGDLLAGDFDGDGQTDVAAFMPTTGDWILGMSTGGSFDVATRGNFPSTGGWKHHVVGDFDGDGRDDIASYNVGNGTWWVSSWDGSGLAYSRWSQFATRTGWEAPLVGDFTGDGRDDVASYYPGNGTWWVQRSDGSGFGIANWASWKTRGGWDTHMVGDLTGDGRDDLASFHGGTGTWWTSVSTGSDFSGSRWATYSPASGWAAHRLGDFDGDGRDDVVSYRSTNGAWWVGRSTGSSLAPDRWGGFKTSDGWTEHVVGDFDGNGRDDVASYHPGNGTWWVNVSRGSSFAATQWANYRTTTGWAPRLVGNVDGDGDDDLIGYHPDNRSLWTDRSASTTFRTNHWGTIR